MVARQVDGRQVMGYRVALTTQYIMVTQRRVAPACKAGQVNYFFQLVKLSLYEVI